VPADDEAITGWQCSPMDLNLKPLIKKSKRFSLHFYVDPKGELFPMLIVGEQVGNNGLTTKIPV
jgi:hypothetical protein